MKRSVWITLIVLIIAGVVYHLRHKPAEAPLQTLTPSNETKLQDLASQDLKKLQNPRTPDKELDESLIRLSERQNPAARARVLERASSPDVERRVKAAMALGYLIDKSSVEKLATLTRDSEPQVRLSAFRALSFRKSPDRLAILKAASTNDSASAAEKILIYSALARAEGLSPDEAAARYVDRMFAALESDSDNPETELFALREIGSLAPREPRIQKKLVDILSKGAPEGNPKRVDLTLTALGLLNRSCPPERASLVQALLQRENDFRLRMAALNHIFYVDRALALKLLDKEALRKDVSQEKQKLFQIANMKKRVDTAQKAPDFCQPQKRPPPPPLKRPPPRNK